ncbi:MAG: DUF2625 domain-containing protein [Capnocytophaga sp.]|nr:DUF2625 domain-containing protein [Capnocytophaga sp.]
MKSLEELIDKEDSAWKLVQEWLNEAINTYEVLPKDTKKAETELLNSQVTTHSPMGAIIYETGGILIDNGWLRILGSGNKKLPRGLMEWNKGKSFDNYGEPPVFLLVADDVLGGFFAINGGALGAEGLGKMFYLAPDTLFWEPMNCGYSQFIHWALVGDIRLFYKSFYWNNWQEEISQMQGNQVFSFFPFLWSKEGKNIEKNSRKIVSIEESYALALHFQQQLSK